MPFAEQLNRLPRPFDAERGREVARAVPEAQGDVAALLVGTAGSSPYLATLIAAEADWLGQALSDPDAALETELADIGPHTMPADPATTLRRAKRRVALMLALADLGGVWSLERITGTLTDFAGLACDLALRSALLPLLRRGLLPGLDADALSDAGGMFVLAMGKMGAHELNYSSDIDLICLFDATRFDPADFGAARQGFVRAVRGMCTLLNERHAGGYVFRTDLRLRPDPSVTPVCMAAEAAERYYESLGRTWERAAYIKARPAAGDVAGGAAFLAGLRPFVWRRHLDFAAIEDAHDIRLRIRAQRGAPGRISVPGHDMKLGRGGIREIEFFTQTRQLIAGGRDRSLRVRGTVDGLNALVASGWVAGDVADTLIGHYRAHREVEHRIQMIADAQTHQMPKGDEGMARIACLMGTDPATMRADVAARLEEVHALTEGFFAPGGNAAPAAATSADHIIGADRLTRWLTFPALRAPRAAEIFRRLQPRIQSGLARAARREEALNALDGFLGGLPAGVQIFSLFEANPQLVDLLIDIAGTAPQLARYLARNAGVFDAVISGQFFAPWPGEAALRAELAAVCDAENDYEARLDAARRWAKDWHFRIGVHHLRGLDDAAAAGRCYADLARAVIGALWPLVIGQFARRHGPPPGRGAAVLGMGSLGAGQLNAASDLDLILIYDPAGQEASKGPRPLPARQYYARLTQALITAASAQMSEGRLYAIDMRLRPSGNQGPVATSLESFASYQRGAAWLWEHLAMTRARVIAGPSDLADEIEALRREIVARPRPARDIARGLLDMRARIAAARKMPAPLEPKEGAGRLFDIALFAQGGALATGAAARDVGAGLDGAVQAGLIGAQQRAVLDRAYGLFWSVQTAERLLSPKTPEPGELGLGAAAFLCRGTGAADTDALVSLLAQTADAAATIIDAAIEETLNEDD